MLCWTDLETTGFNITQDRVLEVACIITTDDLEEVARFKRVTSEAQFIDIDNMNENTLAMHMMNGLLNESSDSNHDVKHVDVDLAAFIHQHKHEGEAMRLSGSQVWYDRSVMRQWLPRALAELSFKDSDVATSNRNAVRWKPEVYAARPPARGLHRAMPDIEDTLTQARYYKAALSSTP